MRPARIRPTTAGCRPTRALPSRRRRSTRSSSGSARARSTTEQSTRWRVRYHRGVLPENEAAQRFTTRFRLTREDGRAAVWFSLQEGLGWLIGVALLTLVCVFWPALGKAGSVAAIVVP